MKRALFCRGNPLLSNFSRDLFRITFAEEQRNTPDRRKSDDGIYNAAEECILPAEKPCDDIKLKKTDATPVETADNGKNQCNSVEHNEKPSFPC